MPKITHYYPDALCVFVKSFREIENVTRDDLILLQTKEIESLSVTLTVANNPGSFSITINDVANRFSIQDDPDTEIKNLKYNSDFQVARDISQRNFLPANKGGQRYYEFDGLNDGKFPWSTFQWGVLVSVDKKFRTPIQYQRSPSGTIIKRWAFDENGDVIDVSGTLSEEQFQSSSTNGQTFQFTIRNSAGQKKTQFFTLIKKSNSDFLTKYQHGVSKNVGRCKIEPMDRVAIFMSKRFIQNSNGTWDYNQAPKTELIRVFTGLVNTVQMGYSDSGNTITVTGEDVTKWLKLSIVPQNPVAAIEDQIQALASGDKFEVTNIFAGLSAPNVIRLLTLGKSGLDTASAKRTSVDGVIGKDISGVGVYTVAKKTSSNHQNVVYDPNTNAFVVTNNDIQGVSKKVSTVDIRSMMGILFTKSAVHVIDPTITNLNYYLAYKTNYMLPSNFQTEYVSRRDICYKVAEESKFNFYADRNGHIWFHPPRYSNGWIFTAENDKLFIIDEDSIVSYGFVEDDTNVYTVAVISSQPGMTADGEVQPEGSDIAAAMARGFYADELLMYKFGVRILTETNPFLSKLGGKSSEFLSDQANFYAKRLLQQMLANKLQGQVTILGRAEIDPGYPVYIPFRNMIYWVETVEHSFTFGGQFTTTLHLAYGHKPWEEIVEVLTQGFDIMHATDGHIRIVKDDSSNQPKTNNSGLRTSTKVDNSALSPDTQTTPNTTPTGKKPKIMIF
jgi:hypothetical protein